MDLGLILYKKKYCIYSRFNLNYKYSLSIKVSLIRNYFKYRQLRKVKMSMRGYRILKDTGQLDLLIRIKEDLTNIQLKSVTKKSSSIFFGAGTSNSEKILKQFMIIRFADIDFNRSILISIYKGNKKLYLPLPYEWRLVLEEYGFQTNSFFNKIIWLIYIIFYYLYGVTVGFQTLIDAFAQKRDFRNNGNLTSSAYFYGLTKNNLPIIQDSGRSFDIISWYNQWNKKSNQPFLYYHSVSKSSEIEINGIPIVFVNSPLTSLSGFIQLFIFFLGLFVLPSLAFLDLIRGRYWHALLLCESFKSYHFRLLNPQQICTDYLFHNSNYLLRPIWTYDAEKMGARILFYFYSSNIERFKEKEGYSIQPYSWQLMTWSKYLVWDEYQSEFIKRAVASANSIDIVGPIYFQDTNLRIKQLPKESILVFDVQPHRDSRYQMLGVVPEYFISDVVNKFLNDIYILSKKYKMKMVLKRKRHIGSLLNKKYDWLINNLDKTEDFISIDPNVSAFRLINDAEIVISLPFTAPALIAKAQAKVSIYYDPVCIVMKDDRAAHGIKIISGFAELNQWFMILNKKAVDINTI